MVSHGAVKKFVHHQRNAGVMMVTLVVLMAVVLSQKIVRKCYSISNISFFDCKWLSQLCGNNLSIDLILPKGCNIDTEHYNECGTACPLTCKNVNSPPQLCTDQCVPGCFCNKGLVRRDDGKCVKPAECPQKGRCLWLIFFKYVFLKDRLSMIHISDDYLIFECVMKMKIHKFL